MRVGVHADAHRLAPLVHPRLHGAPEGGDQGGRRHRPQPPVPRGVAQPRRRGGGADLRRGRAARVRGGHRARARRGRLVPGDQRRRVRRVRGGQALQRPALVPGGRAQRRRRPDDLRQRPDRDDEPRRHAGDDGRLQPRARPVPAPHAALRRRDDDERGVRLDGLLGEDAARADREDPRRGVHGADGLARRRRPQPRGAPAGGDEGDRRGRRHHDRPDGVRGRGADGLQRAVRGVAARGRVLRGPHAAARRDHVPGVGARRTTGSSGR